MSKETRPEAMARLARTLDDAADSIIDAAEEILALSFDPQASLESGALVEIAIMAKHLSESLKDRAQLTPSGEKGG